MADYRFYLDRVLTKKRSVLSKYALNFINPTDFVGIGNTSDFAWMHGKGNNDFQWTVDFMLKLNPNLESLQYIFMTSVFSSNQIGIGIMYDNRTSISINKRLRVYITRGVINQFMYNAGDFDNSYNNNSEWQRVSVVCNNLGGGAMQVYFAGDQYYNTIRFNNFTPNQNNSTRELSLGRSDSGSLTDALVADVRIFNTALTSEKINEYKNKVLTGNEPNLVHYWKTDEGSGLVINDSKGAINGNIQGPVWVTK